MELNHIEFNGIKNPRWKHKEEGNEGRRMEGMEWKDGRNGMDGADKDGMDKWNG